MTELYIAGAIVAAAWLATRPRSSTVPTAPTGPLTFDVGAAGVGAYLAASAARAATVEGIADSAAREGAARVAGALSPSFVGYHGGRAAPMTYTTALEPVFGELGELVYPWPCRPAANGALGANAGAVPVAGGMVYRLGYDRSGAWGAAPIATDGDGVAWVNAGPPDIWGSGALTRALQVEHARDGTTAQTSARLWRLDWPRLRKDAAGAYFIEGIGVAEMRAGQFPAALYARMDAAATEVARNAG